jgi:hypothetical protein
MWVNFTDVMIDEIFALMQAGEVDQAIEKLRVVIASGHEQKVVDRIYRCGTYEISHLLPIMEEMFGVSVRLRDGHWQKHAIQINLRTF